MAVEVPSIEQLRKISDRYGFGLSHEDLKSYQGLMVASVDAYNELDRIEEPTIPVKYRRGPGHKPTPGENPLNAWFWKCSIEGAPSGLLAGKTVAIKDAVAIAGLPMTNGSSVLDGYIPEFDATVVTRVLDAGGRILGKGTCEHLCFSGSSFTSDTGPVLNPHDHKRTSGGSSSGPTALVVAGDVDMAIGGDQGGSIRIPASYSGAYGLKPTYGLVPCSGVFPIEMTLDHVGPIAATVRDVSLLLEAIAGEDPLDPRQRHVRTAPYSRMVNGDVRGLRIGVVQEGFGLEGLSEPDVDEAVRESVQRFTKLGAEVREISLPMHRQGGLIWNAIILEGSLITMIRGNSAGTNWKGRYATSLIDAFAKGKQTKPKQFSDMVKEVVMLAEYMQERYQGHYYAKAQNLVPKLVEAYNDALRSVDVLVMPTLPMKATLLPAPSASREQKFVAALGMVANTCVTDVTGHPAISIPCAKSAGLPVGLMIIGRLWEEATVLQAAAAYESTGVYKVRP